MTTRQNFEKLLNAPNVQKMLNLIADAEGVKHGYNTAFGNERFGDLSQHPNISKEFTQTDGKRNNTTAAGRYQFLKGTWDGVAKKLGLSDFSPKNQDIAAVALLAQNGALPHVLKGDFETAVKKSGSTWASLPSSPYAQPKKSWEDITALIGKPNDAKIIRRSRQESQDRIDQLINAYDDHVKKANEKTASNDKVNTLIAAYDERKAEQSRIAAENAGPPIFDNDGNYIPEPTEQGIVEQKPEQTLLDKAKGVGESALTFVTAPTTGALGYAGGAFHGIAQSIVDGTFGTQEGAKYAAGMAQKGSELGTYVPRTQSGQNIVGTVGDALGSLPPVMGGGVGMQAATLGKAAIPQAVVAAQKAQPVIQQVAQTAVKPVQATVNAAKSGVENLRNAVGMGRVANEEATPANIGAAQVDQATIRQALARDLPVPPELTEGQLSRNPAQLKFEVETAKDGELGAPLRQRYEQQHEAVQQSIDAFVDKTGAEKYGAYDVGALTDNALQKQMTADKNRVRVAYAKADKSEEANTPIDLIRPVDVIENNPMSVIDYLNSQPDLQTTPILSTAKKTAVSLGIAGRGEDGQLVPNNPTIKQMEKWRQEINGNVNAEAPNIRQATILKQFIDKHVEPSAGALYKAARIERKRFANKWENHTIVKNLVTNKTGTEDRRIAIENIVDNVINKSSLDDMRIARRTIMTSGEEGKQAWKEIQGEVLRSIKDAATAGVAPDAQGKQMISPAQLNKAIKKLDDAGKLDFIFGQNGAEKLRALNDVSKAIFTVPASAAINHSNTAATLTAAMDLVLSGMSGFPAPVASALRIATKHIKDNKVRARVHAALNPKKVKPHE